MKAIRMFGLIGLILALLVTAVPAFAADPNPGEGNTDVVVVNTNQDTNASAADVTALYYNTAGVVEYQRTRSLAPRASYPFLASDAVLSDGWNGSMILQSDYELAAVAEITWSNGSASDGVTSGTYTGYANGSTVMYMPFVVYAPNAQFTRVSVQNTEDSVANIQMQYINRDGQTDFTITDSIDGLGSKTYDMHVPGPKIPVWANSPYYQSRGNWGGALKITSLNNKEIVAVATNHWQQWAVAYNGASSGAETNYVPSAERRIDGNLARGFSVIIAQCLESSGTCAVQLQFVNATTGNTDLTLNRTINAGAALGANTNTGGDWPASDFNPLGTAWAGSVIVRTTNSTDIGVVAYSIRPVSLVGGSTSGSNANDAGRETFLPTAYQINTAGQSCAADNQWRTYSLIRIQNPTGTNASDVDIYYFNRDGSQRAAELNNQVQAGKSYNRNTRVHCAQIGLGGSWSGSVYIRADQPLVAVIENLAGDGASTIKMDAYNGYSITR